MEPFCDGDKGTINNSIQELEFRETSIRQLIFSTLSERLPNLNTVNMIQTEFVEERDPGDVKEHCLDMPHTTFKRLSIDRSLFTIDSDDIYPTTLFIKVSTIKSTLFFKYEPKQRPCGTYDSEEDKPKYSDKVDMVFEQEYQDSMENELYSINFHIRCRSIQLLRLSME